MIPKVGTSIVFDHAVFLYDDSESSESFDTCPPGFYAAKGTPLIVLGVPSGACVFVLSCSQGATGYLTKGVFGIASWKVFASGTRRRYILSHKH